LKEFNVPISGFKKYNLNLLNQEITNGRGKVMKVRRDKRGTLITNLVADNGKQTTVVVKKIVKKTLQSLGKWEGSDVILSEVLVAYYNRIEYGIRNMKLIEASMNIKNELKNIPLSDIGRIIMKLQ
jgi:hypothetical protein